jgi:hypothetical protein
LCSSTAATFSVLASYCDREKRQLRRLTHLEVLEHILLLHAALEQRGVLVVCVLKVDLELRQLLLHAVKLHAHVFSLTLQSL